MTDFPSLPQAPATSFSCPVGVGPSAASGQCRAKVTGVRNGGLLPAESAAGRWRAVVKGQQVRRAVRVSALAPGMIAVRLHASPELLERTGLRATAIAAQRQGRPVTMAKQLAWVSLDPHRFSGRVVQADVLIDPCTPAAGETTAATCVRINGGYFNFRQRACSGSPEHLPIGPLRTRGGAQQLALALPPAFADDYYALAFADGSLLASAPLLAERGEPAFAAKACGNPLYRLPPDFCFERGDQVAPGVLWHAHDANPRAAISLPTTAASGRVRVVAAPMSDRSRADCGWTLSEFSGALARLDRLEGRHRPPNTSLNLDGGESVALLAWAEGRPLLDIRQTARPRQVGNLIEFQARTTPQSPELVRCVKLGG